MPIECVVVFATNISEQPNTRDQVGPLPNPLPRGEGVKQCIKEMNNVIIISNARFTNEETLRDTERVLENIQLSDLRNQSE